jgi:hypothetical protein
MRSRISCQVWQAVSAITDDATVELSPCGKRIAVAGPNCCLFSRGLRRSGYRGARAGISPL